MSMYTLKIKWYLKLYRMIQTYHMIEIFSGQCALYRCIIADIDVGKCAGYNQLVYDVNNITQ
jgi:hypothetical protein